MSDTDREQIRDLMTAQANRLAMFKDFALRGNAGRDAMAAWLFGVSGGNTKKAVQIMDAVIAWAKECQAIPEPWQLDGIVKPFVPQAEPSAPLASPDCPDCGGSGYMEVIRGGYAGSTHCRCGGLPPGSEARKYTGKRDLHFYQSFMNALNRKALKKLGEE